MKKSAVQTLLDPSIREHGFRISIELYQHFQNRVNVEHWTLDVGSSALGVRRIL